MSMLSASAEKIIQKKYEQLGPYLNEASVRSRQQRKRRVGGMGSLAVSHVHRNFSHDDSCWHHRII